MNPYAVWYAYEPFLLTERIPIRPAPIIGVSNVSEVRHLEGYALVIRATEYPRALMPGDWT